MALYGAVLRQLLVTALAACAVAAGAHAVAIPRTIVFVCQHGYLGHGAGTSFLLDPVRRKVVRIVIAAGR